MFTESVASDAPPERGKDGQPRLDQPGEIADVAMSDQDNPAALAAAAAQASGG